MLTTFQKKSSYRIHALVMALLLSLSGTGIGGDKKKTPSKAKKREAYGRYVQLKLNHPKKVCGLVSFPGDIILQSTSGVVKKHKHDDTESGNFGLKVTAAIRLNELLSLSPSAILGMNYSHTQMVTEIFDGYNMQSWSFYPPIFGKSFHLEAPFFYDETPLEKREYIYKRFDDGIRAYRTDYAVFRVRATAGDKNALRDQALKTAREDVAGSPMHHLPQDWTEEEKDRVFNQKLKHQYGGNGTCSDWVNWLYDEYITSWWNFIPLVRRLIASYFPPEAISTPDDIAQSPYTAKVCEITAKDTLVFPQFIPTQMFISELQSALASSDQAVVSHATWVRNYMLEKRVLSADVIAAFNAEGEVIGEVVNSSLSSNYDTILFAPPEEIEGYEKDPQKDILR